MVTETIAPERRKVERDISEQLDYLCREQRRTSTALFAKDEENEFESLGLMTIMKKVDNFVNAMCTLAKWLKKLLTWAFWLLTGLGGTVAACRAAGWI